MIIAYEEGKLFVVHSTGHCDIYEKSHLQNLLVMEQAKIVEAQSGITELNTYIKGIDDSLKPKLIARLRSKIKCSWEKTFG